MACQAAAIGLTMRPDVISIAGAFVSSIVALAGPFE